jgi:hypothetical protein
MASEHQGADTAGGPGREPGPGASDRDAGARQDPGRAAVAGPGQRERTAAREPGQDPRGGSPPAPAIQDRAFGEAALSQRVRQSEIGQAPGAQPREASVPTHEDRGVPPAQERQHRSNALPDGGGRVASRSGIEARPWRQPQWPQAQSAPAVPGERRPPEPWASHAPGIRQPSSADWRDQVIRSGRDGWRPAPIQPRGVRAPRFPEPGGYEIGS